MTLINNKIYIIDDLQNIEETTSICYGHFDLIHPGHIRYLQYAKSLADHLIVAVIADKNSSLETGEHNFSESERAESLANLQIVDGVIILDDLSLSELIIKISPDILVLGIEFKNHFSNDISDAIHNIMKQDGRVEYHSGEIHTINNKLLNENLSDVEIENKNNFDNICQHYGITYESLIELTKKFRDTKLLVIGDSIVDHYVMCDALGMSAEAPVIVVKELESQNYIGGAAVVASHIRALGASCHYISAVGNDPEALFIKESLERQGITIDLISDIGRPTTYKTRYVVENQKLFRVSRVKEHKLSTEVEDLVIEKILSESPNINGVVISDFVYGVITDKILETIDYISKKYNIAIYGDLQCSSQIGNITKFKNFSLITPTEKEARVALGDEESGVEYISKQIMNITQSENMLIKLGADGFIAYSGGDDLDNRQYFPALSVNPVDVTGAGDSLLSAMSVSLSSGSSLVEASVIGSCMASCAVEKMGNKIVSTSELDSKIEWLFSY